MVYIRNDVMQQIDPYVLNANANASPARKHGADFLTIHRKVPAKVDKMFMIKCSDVDAFAQVPTK